MLLLLYEIAENLTMVKASISHPGMEKIDTSGAYGRFFRRVPSGYASQFKEDSFLFDRPIYELLKRIMDIFGSLCVVLLTIWLYPIIGFFIWFEDGGSVFHIQDRIGRDCRLFRVYKFRTMRPGADARWPEKKDKRVTYWGHFLRKTRLDELPQLWSVLKGDLSLVGPRPDLVDFYPLLKSSIQDYDLRYKILPGMTGWAQVSQSIQPASVEQTRERFEYDLYYIKNRSLWLDIKILMKTFLILLGVVSKDPSSMV